MISGSSHLVQADYELFYAGKFLKETQLGRNLDRWALLVGYKFWSDKRKCERSEPCHRC